MGTQTSGSKLHGRFLWVAWFLFVAAWSTALLTPHPTKVAEAVFANADHRYRAAKSLHVLAYFVLTVLTALLPARRPLNALLLLFPSLHALTTEGLQNFVPTRTGSWKDVGFDHIGIGVGFAVVGVWHWRRTSVPPKPSIECVEAKETTDEIEIKRNRCVS